MAIEIEDDLILAGKIRIVASGFEESNYSSNSFSSSTRTDPAVQRLANEILALKKQIAQGMFFVPHEDVPRRPLPTIPHISKKLTIEAPLAKVAVTHPISEASDLAILFKEKEEDTAGDSHIWCMQSQIARDEKMKEKISSKVQDGCVIKVDMQASSNQAENDVFVSQGHELGKTLHKCSALELEKEFLINNKYFPKSKVCE